MLSSLRTNERLRQQKYATIWLLPVTLASVVGLALLADKTNSYVLYQSAQYIGLIGAVAFGIMVPKKRDEFRCPACGKLLGWRIFLERGSEFQKRIRKQYDACPLCHVPLFPAEANPYVV